MLIDLDKHDIHDLVDLLEQQLNRQPNASQKALRTYLMSVLEITDDSDDYHN
jgi:hypothetical protein